MCSQFLTNEIESGKKQALNNANMIKVKNILEKDWNPDNLTTIIPKMIDMYEFSIAEKWKSFESSDKDERSKFQIMCIECFTLMQALDVPPESIPKIIHALKILTYGYLGERGESVGRLLSEDKFDVDESSEWNTRVFTTIYKAILHMVQKKSKQDLQRTASLIHQLRSEQNKYEKPYLESSQKGSVYELASLYHMSKATEITSTYLLQGTPPQIGTLLDIHFDRAIEFAQRCGLMELDLLLHMLHVSFKKMTANSVWTEAKRAPKIRKLIEGLTNMQRPVFELMYPQRAAIQNGLLDQFNDAIVVTLPTSSGKTMIAEFKILQMHSQLGNKYWMAYVVPTRALVNQITAGLRHDFEGLEIRVEKMSGALEQDKFEESLVSSRDFDILVTTPEKLNLLLRQNSQASQKPNLCKSLALAVIDEAHNIGSSDRGLALEMLISIIRNDCDDANLLLLTPNMPDATKIARWLNPENPKAITMQLHWIPNDNVIGAFYIDGSKRNVTTYFKPISYSGGDLEMDKICLGSNSHSKHTFSEIKNKKYLLTSYAARYMIEQKNVLVVTDTKKSSWKIARTLSDMIGKSEQDDEDIDLVKKFVKAELGNTFELAKYLDNRVGVHNTGLPSDVLRLMEWLMESGKLNALVSTTTIAQGINFPASSILLSSYHQRRRLDYKSGSGEDKRKMSAIDFLNLAGRVGRTHQSVGLVGIATNGTDSEINELREFLKRDISEIVSSLYKLCNDVKKQNGLIDLRSHVNERAWSNFMQYLAHMYNQSSSLDDFILRSESILRNTYGYTQMDVQTQGQLLRAVKEYGGDLDENREISIMSDHTGFSPHTIESAAQKIKNQNIILDKSLFSGSSKTLTKLIHIMRNDMPELDLTNLLGKHSITDSDLNKIITAWVSGHKIHEISEKYFGGTDTENVQNCITTIYTKIVNFATWGLSAAEKITENTSNMPAMVYYGVSSDEAILMSMNGVPRRIADRMGKAYQKAYQKDNNAIYNTRSRDVLGWLKSQNISVWDGVSDGALTGPEYKKIWQINEGLTH